MQSVTDRSRLVVEVTLCCQSEGPLPEQMYKATCLCLLKSSCERCDLCYVSQLHCTSQCSNVDALRSPVLTVSTVYEAGALMQHAVECSVHNALCPKLWSLSLLFGFPLLWAVAVS